MQVDEPSTSGPPPSAASTSTATHGPSPAPPPASTSAAAPAPSPSTAPAPPSAPRPPSSTSSAPVVVGRKRRVAKQPKRTSASASASADPSAGEEPAPPAKRRASLAASAGGDGAVDYREKDEDDLPAQLPLHSAHEQEQAAGPSSSSAQQQQQQQTPMAGSGRLSLARRERRDRERERDRERDDASPSEEERERELARERDRERDRRARRPTRRERERERELARERERDEGGHEVLGGAGAGAAVGAGYLAAGAGGDRYEDWRFEYTELEGAGTLLWRDEDGRIRRRLARVLDDDDAGFDGGDDDDDDDNVKPARAVPLTKRAVQVLDGLREQRDLLSLPTLPPSAPLIVKPLPLSATSLSLPPIQSAYLPSSLASTSSSSMGGAGAFGSSSSQASSVALCPYPRATAHALFAGAHIPSGAFISPLKGEVRDLEAHVADPIEQYALLGALKGGVRGLPKPWSLVLDQRKYGDEVRFARSGCHPNAVVRVVRLDPSAAGPAPPPTKRASGGRSRSATPHVSSATAAAGAGTSDARAAPQWAAQLPDDPVAPRFALALYALTDIAKRAEIVLPWCWDDEHLAHLLPSLLALPSAPPLAPSLNGNEPALAQLSKSLAHVADALLGGSTSPGGCACDRRKDCALWWLARGGAASCASLTAKRPSDREREPLGHVMMNSLAAAVGASAAAAGEDARARKQNGAVAAARAVDLGPLIGLKRRWYAIERAQAPFEQELVGELPTSAEPVGDDEDMGVARVEQTSRTPSPGPSDDDDELEDARMDVDVDEKEIEDKGASPLSPSFFPLLPPLAHRLTPPPLAVVDPLADLSPASALTSLPSDDMLLSARSTLAAELAPDPSDSDLTEPLSNLSAVEDDDDDDDDLSEVDESVLSPPSMRKPLQALAAATAPSPPPRPSLSPTAPGPSTTLVSEVMQRGVANSDSSLSDADDEVAERVRAPKKKKAQLKNSSRDKAPKKRKTARVYSSSSSEGEQERVSAKVKEPTPSSSSTASKVKAKEDSPVVPLAGPPAATTAPESSSTSAPATPAAPDRPRLKIGVKIVTKTVAKPVEPSPKDPERKKTLNAHKPSTTARDDKLVSATPSASTSTKSSKKRPASGTPSSLSQLKIRKLKDKKAPRIRDQSDSDDGGAPLSPAARADKPSPAPQGSAEPTPPSSAGASRQASVQPNSATEDVSIVDALPCASRSTSCSSSILSLPR